MSLLRFKNYNSKEAAYGVDAMEETHRNMIGELKKKGNKTYSVQAQCSKPTQCSVYSELEQKGTGRLNNWLVFWIY